jgi:hypothetical protein
MMSPLLSDAVEPVVGNWYRRLDDGQTFCVSAVDETHGSVEVRLPDGEVEEIEAGNWLGMDLEAAEAPDDVLTDVRTDELDGAGRPVAYSRFGRDWRVR